MKRKILFYIDEKKIRVYSVRNNIFNSIKYEGNEQIVLEQKEFWEWFENTISFVKGQDKVDFCIITDNSINLDTNRYLNTQNSDWTTSEIERFCNENLHYSKIELVNLNNIKILEVRNKEYAQAKTFTLVLNNLDKESVQDNLNSDDDSPIRKYYLHRLKENKRI